jgi:hypothetical protein
MRLRDLLYLLWAKTILIVAPENKMPETFRGTSHGYDSTISVVCEKYGERYVESIVPDGWNSVAISVF